MNPIIENFETKFRQFRWSDDLLEQVPAKELLEFLDVFAQSGLEYDYGRKLLLDDIFKKYPNTIWLPTILSMLEKFPLNEYGFPYSSSTSRRRVIKENGEEEIINMYHPGMYLINEAFENFPDLFKNHGEFIFIHDLNLFAEEDVEFWEKYGTDYLVFFRNYLSENQTPLNVKRAIVKMLRTGSDEMKALAAATISKNFTDAEELKWLNKHFLQEVGLEWSNSSFRELYSKKPLHMIFPKNYFLDDKDDNFTKAIAPLPHIYKWGGWRTIQKSSGKKLQLQHLLTLDPIPEHLGITSVKKLQLVVDLKIIHEEGIDNYYHHNANGEIVIPEESSWLYDGPDEYVSDAKAFVACDVQLSDQGEEFRLQGWDNEKNINRVGGLPFFVQDEHYPECCDCKRTMPLIIQLDSDLILEDGTKNWWGSGGIAYIYWCDQCRVSSMCWFCT